MSVISEVNRILTRQKGSAHRSTGGGRFGSLLYGAAVILGAGTAFSAGLRLQQRTFSSKPLTNSTLQLAQISADHGSSAYAGSSHGQGDNAAADDSNDSAAPAATLETVYSLVKEHYVDSLPSETKMSYGALRSMLNSLNDPNALFLDPDQAVIFQNEARGKFAGIGAALSVQEQSINGYTQHKIVVVSTLPGSPAEKAGLRPRDVITHIDSKWILGSDPFLRVDNLVQRLQAQNKDIDTPDVQRETDEARRRQSGGIGLFRAQMALRGDRASLDLYRLPTDKLALTVERHGAALPRAVMVDCAPTEVAAVSVPSADKVALVSIPAFTDKTVSEIVKALPTVDCSAGLVLDLRGNAGGVGDGQAAVRVAQQLDGLFNGDGKRAGGDTFAIERMASGRQTTLPSIHKRGDDSIAASLASFRLLVLVDGGTAGAAEALAAALTDTGRATLMGGRTFGSGLVQSVYSLPDGAAFTLPTGRLSSPHLTDWAGKGLSPSVLVAADATDAQILAKATALLTGNARIAAGPNAGSQLH